MVFDTYCRLTGSIPSFLLPTEHRTRTFKIQPNVSSNRDWGTCPSLYDEDQADTGQAN